MKLPNTNDNILHDKLRDLIKLNLINEHFSIKTASKQILNANAITVKTGILACCKDFAGYLDCSVTKMYASHNSYANILSRCKILSRIKNLNRRENLPVRLNQPCR